MSMATGLAVDMSDDSKDRVGVFSHAITREDLRPGDHVYVWRRAFTYAHHGIYTGIEGQEIIHFSGPSKRNAKISAATLDEFCQQSSIRLAAYGCNSVSHFLKRAGTVYRQKSQDAELVLQTAIKYLSDPHLWGDYDVVNNNCEDFAYFCKTGHHRCEKGQASVLKVTQATKRKGVDISKPFNSNEGHSLQTFDFSAESTF